MEANIISIAAGKARDYAKGSKEFQSAYKKDIFLESAQVNKLGIIGDFQCDKRYHGGEDKALHIGSNIHFKNFKELYGKDMDPLAMGCNIIIDNLTEKDICAGDIYEMGDIEIEITQPRQPCWKIGVLYGKELKRFIEKQSATGWYVKVLKEGILKKSDKMVLKKRVSNITIKELSLYLHKPPKDKELIEKILNTFALAEAYKNDLKKALSK